MKGMKIMSENIEYLHGQLSQVDDNGDVTVMYPEITADDIIGTLPIANGGTGATTAADALVSLGAAEKNHTHSVVSTTENGLMSSHDKLKLDKTNIAYATCSTGSDVAEKVVTINSQSNANWSLTNGSIINIKFSYDNTATNPTLNVNGTGAKSVIYSNETIKSSKLYAAGIASQTFSYMYNGTGYVFMGGIHFSDTTNAILGQGFGNCSTGADTLEKVVNISNYECVKGGIIAVRFSYDVPARATLNVNNTGAKYIYYKNVNITSGIIKAGDIAVFMYNSGTRYELLSTTNDIDTTYTKMKGATSSTAGTEGLVPAPEAGSQNSFLRGDGKWAVPPNSTYESLKNPYAITIKSNDTILTEYDGSSAKTVDITPSKIGAAEEEHGTHVTYSTNRPKANGTASAGVMNALARADHVHPEQTNTATATALKTKRTIDGINFDGTASITHFAKCDTAADVVEKTVELENFVLNTGSRITIAFKYTNTAPSPTLNVNGTGAKAIICSDGTASNLLIAANNHNRMQEFVYNGLYWIIQYPNKMIGATASKDGVPGVVPLPVTGKQNSFLKGDGTWADVAVDSISGTLPIDKGGTGGTDRATALYNLSKGDYVKDSDGNNTYDLNLYTDIGYYYFSASTVPTNLPSDLTRLTGYLIVLRGGGDGRKQIWMPQTSDTTVHADIYIRTYASSWLPWVKVPNVDDISLPEDMVGATSSSDGSSGLVPAPATGKQNSFLRGDGTWATPTNTCPTAYSTTAADIAAKTAACTNYSLRANSYIHVTIAYANSVQGAITLNINSKGAKPIYINGIASSTSNYTLPAGTYIIYYDGTNYYFETDGGFRTGSTTFDLAAAPIYHTNYDSISVLQYAKLSGSTDKFPILLATNINNDKNGSGICFTGKGLTMVAGGENAAQAILNNAANKTGTSVDGSTNYISPQTEELILASDKGISFFVNGASASPDVRIDHNGNLNVVDNIYSNNKLVVTEGRLSGSTVGTNSVALGSDSTASGDCSFACGYLAEATGEGSVAFGEGTASGLNAIALGIATASGDCSVALGSGGNTASAQSSTALGHRCTNSGKYSVTAGLRLTNSSHSAFVCGRLNKALTANSSVQSSTSGDIFVIGNGYTDSTEDTGTHTTSNAFRVTYTGVVYGKGAYNTSGADYAEFVKPWFDNNPDGEDRVGYFVTLKDGYLHKANDGDYIIGVTSGNPSVVGNSDEDYYWKYARDEFNRYIYEDVEEEVQATDDEGNLLYNEDGSPIYVKTGNIIKNGRIKLSENYDPSLQDSYIERSQRPEWDYVGMRGIIPVRDDGTCEVGGFCKCSIDGIATKAETRGFDTYFVIERINDNVVSIEVK